MPYSFLDTDAAMRAVTIRRALYVSGAMGALASRGFDRDYGDTA